MFSNKIKTVIEGTVDRIGVYSMQSNPITAITLSEHAGKVFRIGSPQSDVDIALIEKGDVLELTVNDDGWIEQYNNKSYPSIKRGK